MKTVSLLLFVLILSLVTINLSSSAGNNESIKSFSNTGTANESIVFTKNILSMPNPVEDVNSDGVADSDDLAISLVEASNFCNENCQADVTGDGVTDLSDILQIFQYIYLHLDQ